MHVSTEPADVVAPSTPCPAPIKATQVDVVIPTMPPLVLAGKEDVTEDEDACVACGWCLTALLFFGDIGTFIAWVAMGKRDRALLIASCAMCGAWILLSCML